MKGVLVFLPLLFTIAFAQAQSSASANINDEKIPFHYFHGHPFPAYHHHPHNPHPFYLPPHFTHPFPHPYPYPYPYPFPIPFQSQPPSSPSIPSDNQETNDDEKFVFPLPYMSMPPVSDDHMKCFLAVHDRSMKSCLNDFHSFVMTRKISISSNCCSALHNIEDSCPYNNHFLEHIVGQHCGAPSPSN